MMNDIPQWRLPADLRPAAAPVRLTDAVRLELLFHRLHHIEDILLNGIPRRHGARARLPWRERDRIILEQVRAALSVCRSVELESG